LNLHQHCTVNLNSHTGDVNFDFCVILRFHGEWMYGNPLT
jgi:hypothetical protein